MNMSSALLSVTSFICIIGYSCCLLKLVAGTYQTALWYSNASNAAAKCNESQGLTLTKCSYIQK